MQAVVVVPAQEHREIPSIDNLDMCSFPRFKVTYASHDFSPMRRCSHKMVSLVLISDEFGPIYSKIFQESDARDQ